MREAVSGRVAPTRFAVAIRGWAFVMRAEQHPHTKSTSGPAPPWAERVCRPGSADGAPLQERNQHRVAVRGAARGALRRHRLRRHGSLVRRPPPSHPRPQGQGNEIERAKTPRGLKEGRVRARPPASAIAPDTSCATVCYRNTSLSPPKYELGRLWWVFLWGGGGAGARTAVASSARPCARRRTHGARRSSLPVAGAGKQARGGNSVGRRWSPCGQRTLAPPICVLFQ
jgi:hypothetical protein